MRHQTSPRTLYAINCTLTLTLASVMAFQSHAADLERTPLPKTPDIVEASKEADDQIGTFTKPADLKCEVFAAEPDVANPVVFTIDNRGRVFVAESFRQNNGVTDNRKHDEAWLHADLAARTVADRIAYHQKLLGEDAAKYVEQDDRIRLLLDKDQDGKVDESIVFAEHFNNIEDGTGAGVLVRGNTAYYTNIPHLWKLDDEDGDGVADVRTSLHYGYGVRVAFRGHDMHGLIVGPDGRLYFSIGDRGYYIQTANGLLANPESGAVFRCELDGSNLEVVATGMRNPQELAFDNYGNLFTGDNNSDSGDKARWVYVVPGGDSGWRMSYQYLPDRGPFNRENIWYPYNDATPTYTVPPIANISDGPSGLTFDPGTGLTEQFRNAFLLVDFRGQPSNSGIRLIRNAADGAFFKIESDAQPIWSMLATDADYGPDGSLYVSDWVNGWDGLGKGRIYRFFNPDQLASEKALEVKRLLASDWKNFASKDLIDLLHHVDRRVRLESQFELAARTATNELSAVAENYENDPMARLHSVWGIGQIARKTGFNDQLTNELLKLVRDQNPEIAVAAITILGESRNVSIGPTINEAIGSDKPRVAAAAAIAAGRLQLTDCVDVVCMMLAANAAKDPILQHAGIMALVGQPDMHRVVALTNHDSQYVRLAAVVALRKRDDARVVDFLRDDSQRVVLEAVRAIHDQEILRYHLPAIAELELKANADPALVRRVLNANYRDGSATAAERIAEIATRDDLKTESRLEALDMIAKWATPGVTDWIMNRYDPLPDRDGKPASQAIESRLDRLMAMDTAISNRALKVASDFGIKSVESLFRKLLADPNADSSQRVIAINGLLRSEVADSAELLDLLVSDADPLVRVFALKELAKADPVKALRPLTKATSSPSIPERQIAWDLLGQSKSEVADAVIASRLKAYVDGKVAKEIRLNLYEAGKQKTNPAIAALIDEIDAARQGKDVSDPLAYYADSELGGDADAGRKLFFERTQLSCVRCHKVGAKGGEVGPNLTTIATTRSPEYLLESIVAPNAKIAENFKSIIVQTEDGKVYSGIVRKETDEVIELMDAEGKIISVDQDDVIGQKDGLSSMPVDLMKSMTPRELRDLNAYLITLDGTAKVDDLIEGHAE